MLIFKKLLRGVLAPVLGMVLFSGNALGQAHNIKAVNILSPPSNARFPINLPCPITVRFINTGSSSETEARLFVEIKTATDSLVYRDSVSVNSWESSAKKDISFSDFTPFINASWHITAYSSLPGDQI